MRQTERYDFQGDPRSRSKSQSLQIPYFFLVMFIRLQRRWPHSRTGVIFIVLGSTRFCRVNFMRSCSALTSIGQLVIGFSTSCPTGHRLCAGESLSDAITLDTGAPESCVLSRLLYSLMTHDCGLVSKLPYCQICGWHNRCMTYSRQWWDRLSSSGWRAGEVVFW